MAERDGGKGEWKGTGWANEAVEAERGEGREGD